MTQRNQRRDGRYGRRILLVLITAAVTAATVVELTVALNLESATAWTHRAMLGGSIMWILVAATGALLSRKVPSKYPFLYALFITAMAAGSVAGFYTTWLFAFAVWANAILFAIFFGVIVWKFAEIWRTGELEPPV